MILNQDKIFLLATDYVRVSLDFSALHFQVFFEHTTVNLGSCFQVLAILVCNDMEVFWTHLIISLCSHKGAEE